MAERPDPDKEPHGSVRPLTAAPLALLGCLGLVLGYAIRPVSIRLGVNEPVFPVAMDVILWLLAAGVVVHAALTWRHLQRRRLRMEPHRAVNRLMLGKASALAGSLLLGLYAGFVIAHLWITRTDLGDQRLWRAVVAGVASLVLLVAGLVLERACLVRPDDK